MILEFPKSRYDALRTRLDKRIHDVLHSFFANWTNSRIARRQRYKIGIETKASDLTHLQKTIVPGGILRCKDERRTIRDLGIDIPMKREVNNVVLAEWKLLEVCLRRAIAEEDGARLREIGRD